MKKFRTLTALACVLALSVVLAVSAAASTAVRATLRPDLTIRIDGVARDFYNVQGKEVHPILYSGTTYIPIRSVGEWMGKNVNWDQSTGTATIEGARTTGTVVGTPDTTAAATPITLYLCPEYHIVIDGVERTFTDVTGKQVVPVVYNGSIYLPIRAIGEIMDKTVSWNGETATVSLDSTTGDIVTDFDTANPSTPSQPSDPTHPSIPSAPSTTTKVTAEQAKQLALSRIPGATEANLREWEFDYEDGRPEYEGKIIYSGMEYEFTIDATTGTVTEWDVERLGR